MNAQATRRIRGFRPLVTDLEDRRLLSTAVVEVMNNSSYYLTASYRWSPSSSWTMFKEAPGQGMLFSTSNTSGLTPQVYYAASPYPGSQTTATLSQGYGVWSGSGAPPASAAKVYQFQNTATGITLSSSSNSLPTAPSAPVVTASATSTTQASLSWSNISSANGYYVDAMVNGSWVLLGSLSLGSTGCTINGLSAGSTYQFRVGAFNAGGTTWSATQSVTTPQATQTTPNEPTASAAYTPVAGTLFASGGPSYQDIRQGNEGDCWLLSSFAAVAARYPKDIQNMFTSAGTTVVNGATVQQYKVRFYNSNDVAEYVTVDTELPAGGSYYDQVNNGVLWVALLEKAYAEANAAGYVTTSNPGVDSYDSLNGGDPGWAIQAITGNSNDYQPTNFSNLAAAWNAGDIIVLGSDANPSNTAIVGDHAYAVVAYNGSSSTPYTLYNPWGPSNTTYNGHTVYGQFNASVATLNQNFNFYSAGTGAANASVDPAEGQSSSSGNAITYGAEVPVADTAQQFANPSRIRATQGSTDSSGLGATFVAGSDAWTWLQGAKRRA